MLQLLAVLSLLIQIPVFGLMIFAPRRELTQRVTSNYLTYVILGILFVFLVIGLLTQIISLGSTVNNAIASLPADPAAINADAAKPLADALKTVSGALPGMTLIVVGLAGMMDLAGGYVVYRETQRMGTRPATAGVLLALVYLLSALGMLIFAVWHYLIALKQATPVVESVPV